MTWFRLAGSAKQAFLDFCEAIEVDSKTYCENQKKIPQGYKENTIEKAPDRAKNWGGNHRRQVASAVDFTNQVVNPPST
jgi:hypothetical protein